MEIRDRIKAIRTAVGIPQIRFAERIAISTSYISEIENGIKDVNERTMRLIIAEFNVNETWVAGCFLKPFLKRQPIDAKRGKLVHYPVSIVVLRMLRF